MTRRWIARGTQSCREQGWKIEHDETQSIFGENTHGEAEGNRGRGNRYTKPVHSATRNPPEIPKFRNAPLSARFFPLDPLVPSVSLPPPVGVNGPGPRFRWYGHIWYTERYMHHTAVCARLYIDYRRCERGTIECNQRREQRAVRVNIKSRLLRLSRMLISGIFLRPLRHTVADVARLQIPPLRAVLNSATLSPAFSLLRSLA